MENLYTIALSEEQVTKLREAWKRIDSRYDWECFCREPLYIIEEELSFLA